MKKIFLLILISSLIISCKNVTEQATEISLSNITGQVKIDDLFDEFEYIPLETSEISIFGNIKRMIVSDHQFFILDNSKMKKVFVFKEDGTFSHTIGKVGQGPGEYINIEDFTIDEANKQVVILCYPSTVYVYDMEGRFIKNKQLSSKAMFWNISSYKDGFVCSTNHQSSTNSEERFIIYLFDKNFNLKNKLFDALPVFVELPPFVTNPIQTSGDKLVYFDKFTSNCYFDIANEIAVNKVHFDLDKPVPPELYANPQLFMSQQNDYCFFVDAFFVNDVLFSSFIDKGKQCVFIMNFQTREKLLSYVDGWFPTFLSSQGNDIYSFINPLSILEGHTFFVPKTTTTKYPIEIDSNLVIVKFKTKI
jgi:hypothetical protein